MSCAACGEATAAWLLSTFGRRREPLCTVHLFAALGGLPPERRVVLERLV